MEILKGSTTPIDDLDTYDFIDLRTDKFTTK